MGCSACGTQNDTSRKFCVECGAALAEEALARRTTEASV